MSSVQKKLAITLMKIIANKTVRIKNIHIGDPEKIEQYHFREVEDFEFVNPIVQISSLFIRSNIWFDMKILTAKEFKASSTVVDEFFLKRALSEWTVEYNKIITTPLPDNLHKLLEANSKVEQNKCLKGLSLTSDELIAFVFMAFEKYGYKYSQYKAYHNYKGLDETLLPKVIHIEDDETLKTIGNTILTEGQQRQVIEHRKVTVSKFFDNDKNWHCFFLTYRSLRGKENYKDGQPHLHYISDKWGITRDEVLRQLTSKDYRLPSLPHIDFHTHRNPRCNDENKK